MEMSIIKADTLPKRGALLTSTDLNEVYTDINAGFPLNGENVRNEGLALPQFDTYAQSGESGIILKALDHFGESSNVIIPANENPTFPYFSAALVQDEAVVIVLEDNDILRVYFQISAEVNQNSGVFGTPSNDYFWVFWLEWQLAPAGSWSPVQSNTHNQTNYTDIIGSPATYGGFMEDSIAAIFVNACTLYAHGGGSTSIFYPPRRGHCGNYFLLENTGGRTIYGLRIMGRGIMRGAYNAGGGGLPRSGNFAMMTIAPPSTHQITVHSSDISYVHMRNK